MLYFLSKQDEKEYNKILMWRYFMDKTTHRHRHGRTEYDLYADLERIKAALAEASYDVKGRASEILNESTQHVKQTSSDLQEGVANYVAEKPFKSIGLAILSGIVIGFLLRK